MAHSIEARFPYMDRLLVEFVNTIPTHMRVRRFGTSRRYIQKKAMEGYIDPRILRRDNMGLEMPHSLWFLDDFRATADRYFSKKNIDRIDFIDYGAVRRLWDEHLGRKKDHGRALWCLLMLLIWFDLFVYDKNYKDYMM